MMAMNLKDFADKGWVIVQANPGDKGTSHILKYNEKTGKKEVPSGLFKSGYNKPDADRTIDTSRLDDVGLVLTGKESNIDIIDCDTEDAYNYVTQFFPEDYPWKTKGTGKKGGGHIYVRHNPDFPKKFSVKDETDSKNVAIDYIGEGFWAFLPTVNNHTKENLPSDITAPIIETPIELVNYLKAFSSKSAKIKRDLSFTSNKVPHLEVPLLMAIDRYKKWQKLNIKVSPSKRTKKPELTVPLLKALTPKNSDIIEKDPTYKENGYVDPYTLIDAEGAANDLYLHIATRLATDPSVSEDLMTEFIHLYNSYMREPMDSERLQRDYIHHLINIATDDDDKPFFVHEEHVEGLRCITYTLKDKKSLNRASIIFNRKTKTYWAVSEDPDEYLNEVGKLYDTVNYLKLHHDPTITAAAINNDVGSYNFQFAPNKPLGMFGDNLYNTFNPSPFLRVTAVDPSQSPYKGKPVVMLEFLNHLMDCPTTKKYFLSFLKHKLTTLEFSCVVMLLIGVHGTGKSTLLDILCKIVGTYHKKTSKNVICSAFDAYIKESLFVAVEEANVNVSKANTEKNLEYADTVLRLSGSSNYSPHSKGKDVKTSIPNFSTLIFSSNRKPLPLKLDNRRGFVIKTKTPLEGSEWVKKYGGAEKVHEILTSDEEIYKFCYYLTTDAVPTLEQIGAKYQEAPKTSDFIDYVAGWQDPASKILTYVKKKKFDRLYSYGLQFDIDLFRNPSDKIWMSDVYEIYKIHSRRENPEAHIVDEAVYRRNFIIEQAKAERVKIGRTSKPNYDSEGHKTRGNTELNQYYIELKGQMDWVVNSNLYNPDKEIAIDRFDNVDEVLDTKESLEKEILTARSRETLLMDLLTKNRATQQQLSTELLKIGGKIPEHKEPNIESKEDEKAKTRGRTIKVKDSPEKPAYLKEAQAIAQEQVRKRDGN